ncbi:hypothetical protein [Thalassovita gelatinovora]|nr:hypothetical protein [Thalassovita gelatinovora]QIZ79063.1 hypothetical protein HFZ77_00520 [Thalassovita gelatinovora]
MERSFQKADDRFEACAAFGRMGGPLATDGKEMVGIKALLEWAFAVEKADLSVTMDHSELGGYGYASSTAAIMRHEQLGCRIDGGGKSDPHPDAEAVADMLVNCASWSMAIRVAELSRAGRVPEWDLGQQRLQPRAWSKRNHLGQHGKTEVCRVVEYVQRGRQRRREDLWVPCCWVPSHCQIAAARRDYLDWWGALLELSSALNGYNFDKFHLIDRMPPMTPWKKAA